MILRLIREPSKLGATLGSLYVNGEWACWTLEDTIREVSGVPVEAWKVAGQTAIPQGDYFVRITQSARFGRALPLLETVPGFTGVRMHPGNTAENTEGCILLGNIRKLGRIEESVLACDAVQRRIASALAASETVNIRIENPSTPLPS